MLVYIKIFLDDLEAMEALSDAERGRLLTAMLKYAQSGEVPQLSGNERILFPIFRGRIDRDAADIDSLSEKKREAGRAGGLAKASSAKQKLADASSAKQTLANLAKTKTMTKTKTKTIDKDEEEGVSIPDGIDTCTEPQSAAVLTMILNDGSEYPITQEYVNQMASLFPAVDVLQEMRSMAAWCLNNPAKRKTRSGIKRFIGNWLSKCQDKGGQVKNTQATTSNPFKRIGVEDW